MEKLTLVLLSEKLGICHLDEKAPTPSWVEESAVFSSITRTKDELSIVYPQNKIPGGVLVEKDWRAFKLEGVVDPLSSVGIIAALAKPLAEAEISIFNISTFETNYIMVEEKNLAKAIKVLSKICEIRQ